MILYLDSSALVKRYIAEPGSDEVLRQIEAAEVVGTSAISLAEVSAALAKAVRLGTVPREVGESAYRVFRREWPDMVRLPVNEVALERAASLVWTLGLRGYDAVQIAAAVSWQETVEAQISFATFDRQLWTASSAARLASFPDDLPALLDSWKLTG
jgi:predicted nucleic acid-binding protein